MINCRSRLTFIYLSNLGAINLSISLLLLLYISSVLRHYRLLWAVRFALVVQVEPE